MRSSTTRFFVGACAFVLALAAGGAGADTVDGAAGAEPAVEASSAPWRRPPVSLRGGTTLDRGQVVLGYRFERIGHDELQSGRSHVSPESVLGDPYATAPVTLDLDRHVFSALWSPVPQLTFELELPFVRSASDQIYTSGPDTLGFDTVSSGFGDVMLWVLYRVYRDEHANLHLNLGLSFPSGSIAEAQPPPEALANELERLGYPLQLGSGTVDLQPGFTYAGRYDAAAWGLQALAVLRAGTNEFDYILGNAYEITGWGGWAWNDWLSNSFSLRWSQRFSATGADPAIDPDSSPLANLDLHAYERLDALFGVAIEPSGGRLQRTRWVLDAGLPAYQRIDGPQARVKWLLQFALEVTI